MLQFLQGLFVPRSQDQATSFRVEFVSESASNALGGPGQEYYLKETRDMVMKLVIVNKVMCVLRVTLSRSCLPKKANFSLCMASSKTIGRKNAILKSLEIILLAPLFHGSTFEFMSSGTKIWVFATQLFKDSFSPSFPSKDSSIMTVRILVCGDGRRFEISCDRLNISNAKCEETCHVRFRCVAL